MFRRTWREAKSVLLHHKGALIALVILGGLMGLVPTLKTTLESSVFNKVQEVLESGVSRPFAVVLHEPLPASDPDAKGLVERVSVLLVRQSDFVEGVALYVVLAVAGVLLGIVNKRVRTSITQELFTRLRGAALQRALIVGGSGEGSMPNPSALQAAGIHLGVTNVVNTYGFVIEAAQEVFSLATALLLIIGKSSKFAAALLACAVLQASLSILQAKRLKAKREAFDSKRNELVARSDDILAKREIVLAFDQGKKYTQKLDKLGADFAVLDRKLDVAKEAFERLRDLTFDLGRLSVLGIALLLAVGWGDDSIRTIGGAYFLIAIYARLITPTMSLFSRYDDFKESEATSATYLKLLEDPWPAAAVEASGVRQLVPEPRPGIVFQDVTFSYPGDKSGAVLKGCTFEVPHNKTTLIMGPSGCGKSTVARILLGFQRVDTGRVLIDGQDIRGIPVDKLRERMSYVSQGDHVIDDTVRENLSWAWSEKPISDAQMLDALLRVGLDQGQDGSTLNRQARELSVGEQQRLSFARMLLDESEILILDEPLTGVDAFTLRDITPRLEEILGSGRTVLMIAHRLAFVRYADHVVVLATEEGKKGQRRQTVVAQQGRAEDLFREEGVFRELYEAELRLRALGDGPPEVAARVAKQGQAGAS